MVVVVIVVVSFLYVVVDVLRSIIVVVAVAIFAVAAFLGSRVGGVLEPIIISPCIIALL